MSAPAPHSFDPARLLLPFNLLALTVLVLMSAMLVNTLREGRALREQIEMTDMHGQRAVAARLHYFELFRGLVALAASDNDAKAIVQRYGIEFTEPPPAKVPEKGAGNGKKKG